MNKTVFLFFMCAVNIFLTAVPVQAFSQAERVDKARTLLAEVDKRSRQEIINDLNFSESPEGQLQIFEAIAQTYKDMVVDYEVKTQAKKEWLHSMILLNVAYFQFGGGQNDVNDSALNVVIRRKLKNYMSESLFTQSGLFYSLDE